MVVPTVIVAEREPVQYLSVRTLVLETAGFNVLTAHGTNEALETFRRFRNADIIVLVDDKVIDVDHVANAIKKIKQIPIIALTPRVWTRYKTDYTISSHEPEELVELVRSVLGDPRKRTKYDIVDDRAF
jgi:DNA-binding response OmpR family regulator